MPLLLIQWRFWQRNRPTAAQQSASSDGMFRD
jgi:hypothetical protein